MAVLFLACYLRIRAAELLEEENRIVAETVRPTRLFRQRPFREVGNDCEDAAPLRDCRYADKAGAPLRTLFSFHFAQ
jgi:hypothetical protein